MTAKVEALRVELSRAALNDLFEINDYYFVEVNDEFAAKLIDKLEAAVFSLSLMPSRGHTPAELIDLGFKEMKEIVCDQYRIIYEVVNKTVFVHGILDSRRDVQTLLHKRLLR